MSESSNSSQPRSAQGGDEIRDVLPADLNAVDHAGEYRFPDNSRRRIPATIYLAGGAVAVIASIVLGDSAVLANAGLLTGGILLCAVGLFGITSGWRMTVDEQEALASAASAVGFAVGHASAQQVWRGIRSRPTWRVLCYSDEEPPTRRGLVLVDAVDGRVIEHLSEEAVGESEQDWA
mgnify:CR=1 FL=1